MPDSITAPHSYEHIPGDTLGVRKYTLANGLQVFLSVNHDEPRIFTNICFRVGSKYDPADTTGLAHYMEHMLFKGTSQIGATNWEQESALLEQIADLFEVYRRTQDEDERRVLYAKIDQLSYQAALLVAPNEYDRLVTAIGAKGTNAYTWVEQTVYVNDIPSNELGRWVTLERERFRHLALRLFHTELETVYEEFNMSQDKDFRKAHQAMRAMLFPNHPYGTQTTLGKPADLKNPSMRNIEEFYRTYYVPNNAALCLAGDFDPDEAIALIEAHFGDWEAHPFPPFTHEQQPFLTTPQRQDVLGQESAYVQIGWRTQGGKTDDYMLALLVRQMLFNEQAGLFDLFLNQEQKVLEAEVFNWVYEDYGVFGLYGKPREGQTLEEVAGLLLGEVEKLRQGDFPDWLMEAAIRDMKLADLKAVEKNDARVGAITSCFTLGIPWEKFVHRYAWLEQLTKADIVRFAQQQLHPDTYAAVYKLEGDDPNIVKVEKPTITPIALQKEAVSDYAHRFLQTPPARMAPIFADFDRHIHREEWQPGLRFDYVYNPHNPLFRLDYIFEIGKNHNLELALAFVYLPYLGTNRYSAADIQREFFRLGLHFEAYNHDERCYVSLTGLEESMEAGIQLVEHILAHVEPNAAAWQAVVADILTKRSNLKHSKDTILRSALGSYAKYGPQSPFTHRLPEQQLRQLAPEQVLRWIKDLASYEHRVHYYGQQPAAVVAPIIRRHHQVAAVLQAPPPLRKFAELLTDSNKLYFTHFPMVQNDILMMSRGTPYFNMLEHSIHDLYNEYFGFGLSSIVFQEMREAKALAYSTYAYYNSPAQATNGHYLRAYVGTQPDKVTDALPTLVNLMENMPVIEDSINQARLSLLQRIESDRIPPRRIYTEAQSAWDINLNHDIFRDIYERLQAVTSQDLVEFHAHHVQGRKYHTIVMGDRATTPLAYLENFGDLQELSLEELFGY
ncbi:MAG: insulinase family protein [Bacteroidetes bacterium]|nr:MAG: insulinase family protein [Bacteroidota bacterium]PTM08031.1 MAG: insulinase family protein [Bacteroidota bacterium]